MRAESILDKVVEQIMEEPELTVFFDQIEDIYAQAEDEGRFSMLEIRGQMTREENTKFILLRALFINDEEMLVPNIFLPILMRGKGLGMKILETIYAIAKEHNFRLFITDMTVSFYYKMLMRGAELIDADTVEITEKTKLHSNEAKSA